MCYDFCTKILKNQSLPITIKQGDGFKVFLECTLTIGYGYTNGYGCSYLMHKVKGILKFVDWSASQHKKGLISKPLLNLKKWVITKI